MRNKTWLAGLIFAFLAAGGYAAVDQVSLHSLMAKEFDGRDLKLERVLSRNKEYTRYYITYFSGNLKISGIMNVPAGPGPFPVIITAHGHIDPRIYTNGRGLKREQDYLARRGYVVLHPDYRNHNGSDKDPDNDLKLTLGYTEDVINAIYAVKDADLAFLDKENIGLLGHSMGGGIALNIMVSRPDLVKAYVLFAPTSLDYRDNFERWTLRQGFRKDLIPRENLQKILQAYGSPETNPAFWEGISPRTYLKNVAAPILLHHGTSDQSVPIAWSEKLAKALEAEGKNIKFYTYKGERHEFINAWPLVMKRSVDFFDSYLRSTN